MFKDKLIALRKRKKLTQKQLGKLIYVSRSTVCKWEMGLGIPSDVNIKSLCELFDVSEDWLMHNNDNLSETIIYENRKLGKLGKILIVITSILLTITLTYNTAFFVKLGFIKSNNYQRDYLNEVFTYNDSVVVFDLYDYDNQKGYLFCSLKKIDEIYYSEIRVNQDYYSLEYKDNNQYLYEDFGYSKDNLISITPMTKDEFLLNLYQVNIDYEVKDIKCKIKSYNVFKNKLTFNTKFEDYCNLAITFPCVNGNITINNVSLSYLFIENQTAKQTILIDGKYNNKEVTFLYNKI